MRFFATLLCAALVAASGALALDMPSGAQLAREQTRPAATYAVPIAAYSDETVPSLLLRGPLQRQAWHLPGSALTPVQATDMLARQLEAEGYTPAFACDTDRCGGFDFRFGIDVMAAPDMFVNLRNFHFASFLRGGEGAPDAAVTVLASRTPERLYLQVVTISTESAQPVLRWDKAAEAPADPAVDVALMKNLLTRGSVVLDGLEFESGATTLGPGPFEALTQLAQVLIDKPDLRIALVGHTDSIGGLEGNILISKQRAEAVRARLIERYGIRAARLDAEGMGYLAPRASNLTPAGREANRRVEAIVLSAE